MLKNIFHIWFKIPEKLRFIIVGGYNTTFSYLLFLLLNYLLHEHLHYLFILTIAHILSIFNSFFNFRFFVFRSNGKLLKEFAKVNLVYFFSFVANFILLYILKDQFHLNIALAQLICVISIAIGTYFGHKFFSFK